MQRIDSFPTPIWVEDLTELAPQRETLVQAVRDLRKRDEGITEARTNRHGWHSENNLFEEPAFAVLQQRLVASIKAALADYGVMPGSLSFRLPAWANVHDRGGYNQAHIHAGSILSGTLYLSAPPGSGAIYFTDPRPASAMEAFERSVESVGHNQYYQKSEVKPKDLRLLMFPSWLPHGVEPCECDERISVAFNVEPILMRPG